MKRATAKQLVRAPEAREASGARLLVGSGFLVAAFGVAVSLLDERTQVAGSTVGSIAEPPGAAQRAPLSVPSRDAGARPAARWDGDFVAFVGRKYRYLLADAGSIDGRLMPLLLEWENAASVVDAHRRGSDAGLFRIENELRAILPEQHFATFRLLRGSDEEQHHLQEFTGGVSNVTPLTAQQQRAVLEIKLRHKQAYDEALGQSGFHRDSLSTAERNYVHGAVAAALSTYRNDYLQDVRQMLDDEQYLLLSNYESTEFDRELQRLQMAINAK